MAAAATATWLRCCHSTSTLPAQGQWSDDRNSTVWRPVASSPLQPVAATWLPSTSSTASAAAGAVTTSSPFLRSSWTLTPTRSLRARLTGWDQGT